MFFKSIRLKVHVCMKRSVNLLVEFVPVLPAALLYGRFGRARPAGKAANIDSEKTKSYSESHRLYLVCELVQSLAFNNLYIIQVRIFYTTFVFLIFQHLLFKCIINFILIVRDPINIFYFPYFTCA